VPMSMFQRGGFLEALKKDKDDTFENVI